VSGGEIVGILPLVHFKSRLFSRCLVSMPFLNYGGVVADTPAAEGALLAAAIDRAQAADAVYLELRHISRRFPVLPFKSHKVAMLLQLAATPDEQWARLDRKARNQVRKAMKSNVSVVTGGTDLLDAFYHVFATNMRDLGTPVYTKTFFREVLAAFPREAHILCAYWEKKPVAASLMLCHRAQAEVPWASSIARYNPLCPNMLIYWEMLRASIVQGSTQFDFGRCTPLGRTYRFKEQWGAVPRELCWEYWLAKGQSLPDLSPSNASFSPAIAVWRRLPVSVTKVLGPRVVRNIP
jgi:FemAB-related protein (PEP-CTERM system-associated)